MAAIDDDENDVEVNENNDDDKEDELERAYAFDDAAINGLVTEHDTEGSNVNVAYLTDKSHDPAEQPLPETMDYAAFLAGDVIWVTWIDKLGKWAWLKFARWTSKENKYTVGQGYARCLYIGLPLLNSKGDEISFENNEEFLEQVAGLRAYVGFKDPQRAAGS